MFAAAYPGLDLLASPVVLVDEQLCVRHVNPAAENLFEVSATNVIGHTLSEMFEDASRLSAACGNALAHACSYVEHDLLLATNGRSGQHLSCIASPVEDGALRGLLLEFRDIDQQLRIAREERMLDQSQANRELIRNLAHEIRNPLGGIRGAAQLLERELPKRKLHEYTQVIMKEADRLQSLMDRLLTPHRLPQPMRINIHEVLDRVRSVIAAEMPRSLAIKRDYDVSLPPIEIDPEQIIQALLNIARNAAQALQGSGEIILRTRIARNVPLAKKRRRHALLIQIIDDGPGIPPELRDKVFHPLVSGREGGSGLGLPLAQTFISQHNGSIEFDSQPGRTCFSILLPVSRSADT
ncbi:MAG TPA: nitrogen regulation protein NR(II) [Burkholderiales bacterium]|nr:nitrogen regulation protein NR(II) [Burkholderiales bacterium]